MTLKLTPKKQQELYEQMAQRLGQGAREMIQPPTIAERIYPHLKTKPADDQPKPGPVMGWAHLKEKAK
jgi:hypothetical protein